MKKGFTLIELLAVIVILAIIALIALPIIINIINDARETSYKRSIELYGKAVENAVANYQVNNPNNDAVGKFTTSKPLESINGLNINYDGTEVSCDIIYVYEDGNIYMEQCSVGTHPIENYTYGKAEILVTPATTSETGNVPTGEYNPGDEYTIHIGGENRTFFILSENSDSTKVDLIMSENIGDPVVWLTEEDYISAGGLQTDWDNQEKLNIYGAITANKYLATQTSTWEVTPYLPTYEQISVNGTIVDYGVLNLPIWLTDHLDGKAHPVPNLYGYWTSSLSSPSNAWYINPSGMYSGDKIGVYMVDRGVRPVITLRKSFLN